MSSWWVEDFDGRLRAEQARMKRELAPAQLERVYERLRRLEERELRGLITERCEVAPVDHVISEIEEVLDGTEEERTE
jgi:hypothetical protein